MADDLESGLPDPTPSVHNAMTAARAEGWGWGDILGWLGQASDAAAMEGYSQAEVDAHLGYKPDQLQSGLAADHLQQLQKQAPATEGTTGIDPFQQLSQGAVKAPTGAPEVTLEAAVSPLEPGHPIMRQYADALLSGSARGPDDFAKTYVDTLYSAAGRDLDNVHRDAAAAGLAAQLPTFEDTTDRAIALTVDSNGNVDPSLAATARSNLLDFWAQTGELPGSVQGRVDPLIHDALTKTELERPATLKDLEQLGRDQIQDPMGNMETDPTGLVGTAKAFLALPAAQVNYREQRQALVDAGASDTELAEWDKKNPNPSLEFFGQIVLGALGAKLGAAGWEYAKPALMTRNIFDLVNDESGSLGWKQLSLKLGEERPPEQRGLALPGGEGKKPGPQAINLTVPFAPEVVAPKVGKQGALDLGETEPEQLRLGLKGGRNDQTQPGVGNSLQAAINKVEGKGPLTDYTEIRKNPEQLTFRLGDDQGAQQRELHLEGGAGEKPGMQALNLPESISPERNIRGERPGDQAALPLTDELQQLDLKILTPKQQTVLIHDAVQDSVDRIGKAAHNSTDTVHLDPPDTGVARVKAAELDLALENNRRQAIATKTELFRAVNKLPQAWLDPGFQKRAVGSIEARLANPGHVHDADVQQYLDAIKPLTDREKAAGEQLVGRLKGTDMEHAPEAQQLLSVDQGYSHRIRSDLKEDSSLGLLDPNVEKDVVTGMSLSKEGRRGLSTFASGAQHAETYVLDDGQGNRIFGTKPLSQLKDPSGRLVRIGEKIRDASGKEWWVKRASTDEVEANTPMRFYRNHIGALVENIGQLERANANLDVIGGPLVKELTENGYFVKAQPGELRAPNGMSRVNLPQMQGWAHPKIANVLNSFFDPQGTVTGSQIGHLVRASENATRYLTSFLFVSPAAHALNVFGHWAPSRGWSWINPVGYGRMIYTGAQAAHDIWTLSPRYIEHLRNSSGLLYANAKLNGNLFELVMRKVMHEQLADEGGLWGGYAKAFGLKAVKDLVDAEYAWSRRSLWFMGDWMMLARQYELEARGVPTLEAVRKAERDIPNYYVPPEVMRSENLSGFLRSPLAMVFGRYRYGQVKSIAMMAKDAVAGANPETGAEGRLATLGKITALGTMAMVAWPAINHMLQSLTGNPNTEVRPFGPLSLIEAGKGLYTHEKTWGQAMGSFFTMSPMLQILNMVRSNEDIFGRPIVNERGSFRGKVLEALEAAAQQTYPGQLLMRGMKDGPSAIAKELLALRDHKTPDPKWQKRDEAAALAREKKDPFAAWLGWNDQPGISGWNTPSRRGRSTGGSLDQWR